MNEVRRVVDHELEIANKEIYLERCPRTLMSFTVLEAAETFSFALLFLRVYIFSHIDQITAMIISISCTFVAMAESEIESKIFESGSILTISMTFKIMNACLTIMVFTYNGNSNDYFIGLFFFFTCFLGRNYFRLAGFRISG